MAKRTPLYQRILGATYAILPAITQNIHDVDGEHVARGRGRVARSRHALGNWLADLLGMPKQATDIPVSVKFLNTDRGETISRNYDGHILTTHQNQGTGADAGLLTEKFGPVTLFIHLEGHRKGIDFHLRKTAIGPLPLPRALRPHLIARERSDNGQHHYSVQVGLPLIGTLIEYEGRLDLERQAHHDTGSPHFDVV